MGGREGVSTLHDYCAVREASGTLWDFCFGRAGSAVSGVGSLGFGRAVGGWLCGGTVSDRTVERRKRRVWEGGKGEGVR